MIDFLPYPSASPPHMAPHIALFALAVALLLFFRACFERGGLVARTFYTTTVVWTCSMRSWLALLLFLGGDIETNPGPKLTLASLNVTSLFKHLDSVVRIPADVIGVQETALVAGVQEELTADLRTNHPHWKAV